MKPLTFKTGWMGNNMDLKELFKVTMKSAAKHVAEEIDGKKHKEQFLKHSLIISDKLYFENLEDLKFYFEEKIYFINNSVQWWSFFKPHQAELEAYTLGLDICNSFITRFVSGGEGEGNALIK